MVVGLPFWKICIYRVVAYALGTVPGIARLVQTIVRFLVVRIPSSTELKNVFEIYPGGLGRALNNFEKAWEWALQYQFSSLHTYIDGTLSPIIDKELLLGLYKNAHEFKKEAKEALALTIQSHDEKYSNLLLEPW